MTQNEVKILLDFYDRLFSSQKDMPEEFVGFVSEHFWELI